MYSLFLDAEVLFHRSTGIIGWSRDNGLRNDCEGLVSSGGMAILDGIMAIGKDLSLGLVDV